MRIWSHWSNPISSSWFKSSGMWLYMVRLKSVETNARATEEISALNQSRGGCNHPTSNWPKQGPYLGPSTPDYLSPLWSDIDHWPYAPGLYSVTGKSWRILHIWLIKYSLRNNSWDFHCEIHMRSGILLSDMNGQAFYIMFYLNHPWTDAIFKLQLALKPG